MPLTKRKYNYGWSAITLSEQSLIAGDYDLKIESYIKAQTKREKAWREKLCK